MPSSEEKSDWTEFSPTAMRGSVLCDRAGVSSCVDDGGGGTASSMMRGTGDRIAGTVAREDSRVLMVSGCSKAGGAWGCKPWFGADAGAGLLGRVLA